MGTASRWHSARRYKRHEVLVLADGRAGYGARIAEFDLEREADVFDEDLADARLLGRGQRAVDDEFGLEAVGRVLDDLVLPDRRPAAEFVVCKNIKILIIK